MLDNKFTITKVDYSPPARLIASVMSDKFGQSVLDYVSTATRLRNFGAYYVPNIKKPKPVLTIWAGKISDYWFRHNSDHIVASDLILDDIKRKLSMVPHDGLEIEIWRPSPDDFRYEMFRRAKVIERLSIFSVSANSGMHSFYLRSVVDGPLRQTELERLAEVLPVAHELMWLRQKVVGSPKVGFEYARNASSLQAQGVHPFEKLSKREVEGLDCISRGLGIASTAQEIKLSKNSVKTLRTRAYRKINVSSAAEAMTLMMSNRSTPSPETEDT